MRIFFLLILSFASFAHTMSNPDPYESFNRKVHDFNMAFDATFLKPPARLYQAVIPASVRAGVNNFYTNLHLFPTIANDLLQADIQDAALDFWRLLINSTFGIAGIFDVANRYFQLKPHSNDLGLTFAKWGNKSSPYIVIPLLGPSTIRDGMGMLFDYSLFMPYPYLENETLIWSLLAVRYVDLRSQLLDQEPLMAQAMDRYAFIRDAYLQHRNYLIKGKMEDTGALYIDDGIEEPVLRPKHAP